MNLLIVRRTLALLLTACLLSTGAHAAHDLRNFEPGSYVTGPRLSGKDIRGKVVVIEYWGITCGPCLDAIPHTTELAKKYGHDKLVIIANQSWSASDKNTKETWNRHAKNNMVMVVNGGKLKGYRPDGVPSALVFDHTGKSVWEGFPGGSMDRVIADAVANLPKEDPVDEAAATEDTGPAPIVAGLEPEYFLGEVRRINAQQRSIASAMAKLRRAAERSTRQGQKDEAKMIVAAVGAWAKEQQSKADAALADDPATAYTTATTLIKLLESDELAKSAHAITAQIEKDDDLFDSVRATIALRGIVAQARSIGLDRDPAVAKEKKHARSVRQITLSLGRLIKAYPQTEAGKEAKTLEHAWGLGR